MEIYYDTFRHAIVKYERSTGKFVVGNTDGQVASLFYREAPEIDRDTRTFVRIN